jgi:hypothetical protein
LQRYEQLLELVRRSAEAIEAGAWDDLVELGRERRDLMHALPERPPAEARAILEEAAKLADANVAALVAAVESVRADLRLVERGRNAMSSYGETAPPSLDAIG